MSTWRNRQPAAAELKKYLIPGSIAAAFDTETTGIGKNAKIIQFSGVLLRVMPGYQFQMLPNSDIDVYINPEEKLSSKIIDLTHITQAMVDGSPTEDQLCIPILNWLSNANVWCAYNANFDVRMLQQMCDRQRISMLGRPVLDVLVWARDNVPSDDVDNYKLATITEHLCDAGEEDSNQFHSSIEDVKAMVLCMNKLAPMYLKDDGRSNLRQVHLEKAGLFINPHQPSQKRIRLQLNAGSFGDIYYDIVGHKWACKTSSTARRLFESIDMQNLEKQFLEKYAYPFNLSSADDVAKSWMKFKREKSRR